MEKLILFFIISILSLNWGAADNSKKIEDLELELDEAVAGYNYEQTINAADELLKYEPKHAKALFGEATALTKFGKYSEALVLFNLAIQYKYRDLGYLYYSMGYCLEKLNKLQAAFNAYDLSIKYGVNHRWVYFDKDRVLMKLGKLGINAKKIIDLETEFSTAAMKKDWQKVIIIADELLKYKLHYHVAYYEKARALCELDRSQEAIILYNQALKYKYPSLGWLFYERGQYLKKLGKFKEALKSYDLSIKHGNNDPWVYDARDQVLIKLNQIKLMKLN